MTIHDASVNRAAAGIISLLCLATSIALIPWSDSSNLAVLQGGLARGGLLMGAFWLAMPSRNREAAWANFSPRTIIGFLLVAIVTIRVPLRILIPAALVVGAVVLVLRPRPKRRPSNQIPG